MSLINVLKRILAVAEGTDSNTAARIRIRNIARLALREEVRVPDEAVNIPAQASYPYVILYHHCDPAKDPSFVARKIVYPSLEHVKAAVTEAFNHNRNLVGARVYMMNNGELTKVADAMRGPAWTYY